MGAASTALRAQCRSLGKHLRDAFVHTCVSLQIPVWDWCPILCCPHGELDRVTTTVGVRVVHAAASSIGRKTWSATAAVVLDEAAAARGRAGLPRRPDVTVLSAAEPVSSAWAAAVAVGAQEVLTLPGDEHDLIRGLAEAAESVRDDRSHGGVLVVIGGVAAPASRCSRPPWREPWPTRCWSILIHGAAASICCSAPRRHRECAGPTWPARRTPQLVDRARRAAATVRRQSAVLAGAAPVVEGARLVEPSQQGQLFRSTSAR